jgi:hypothetical protein
MADLKWLEGYSGQSTGALVALEGCYRTDSLVLTFEQAISQKMARIGRDRLTDEERVVLAIEALEREVNSGGYLQFFDSAAEFAPTVVDALNQIGCGAVAAVTEEAIGALRVCSPVTAAAISEAMGEDDEERNAKLDACDAQYYAVAGDLAGPLLEYIKRNRDKIDLLSGA